MVALPDEVKEMINSPTSSKVLATVRLDGNVHVISVGSIMAPDAQTIAFGAILMKETTKNLEMMRKKSLLVSVLVTSGTASYQVRGRIEDMVKSGPLFDQMNEGLKKIGLKANSVWTIEPTEVWNQSASYDAGKKMV